jgi:carbon-monoxide dehydrogenase medium subunit
MMKSEEARAAWSIETDAPLQAILDRPDTPPLLRQTLTATIPWQTRNETTVGRALASPRVAPQWVAALLALGATVVVEGEEVPLEEMGRSRPSGLHVPPGGPDRRWGEAHVARTPADEPIVAAVAVVEVEGDVVRQARVALTGVWPEPARLAEAPARLAGGPLDEGRIQEVAAAVEEEVAPKGDFRGSEEYRRAMAGVLTRRALEQCSPGGGPEGERGKP